MGITLLPVLLGLAAGSQDWLKVWTGVLESCGDVACVRGRLDLALDRALNMTSIPLAEGVTLVATGSEEGAPRQEQEQDLLSKLVLLFNTRSLNIELANVNDGRGKKKKYYEYLYLAALVAAVVIPLKLQGLALVAGKASLIAKVKLMLILCVTDGRGKKKKFYEYLYLAALVAAVVIPLKLQGLALVAGKALLIAKVALALAGTALLKKLSSDEHHRRVDVQENPYLLGYRDQR